MLKDLRLVKKDQRKLAMVLDLAITHQKELNQLPKQNILILYSQSNKIVQKVLLTKLEVYRQVNTVMEKTF